MKHDAISAVAAFMAGDDAAAGAIPPPKPMLVLPPLQPKADAPRPTAYVRRPVSEIPPRPWVYGDHLQRRTVSVTAAPGAVGKTSLTIAEAVAMASGRALLGVDVPEPVKVWLINLEEPRDELERRMEATLQHHMVGFHEIEGRFFLDGAETELCVAKQIRGEAMLVKPVSEALIAHLREFEIDHLTVDPFVSSHRIAENDNGAIDLVAKEWARIARECNCSIELVHHTRKANGNTLSSEDMRGGSSLLNAARDGRVLNRATLEQKQNMGVDVSTDRATYFSVTQDKPNYSTGHGAQWHRTVGVNIGNGDWVATVEVFTPADAFDGISTADVLRVQKAIADLEDPRESAQSANWVGHAIADVLELKLPADKKRVKALIKKWLETDVLKNITILDAKRNERPGIGVGEWINDLPDSDCHTCPTRGEA